MGSKKHRRKQQAQQQAQAAPAPTGASQQQQRQQYAPASMLPQGGIPYMTAGDTMGWQPVAAACVGLPAGWEAQLLKQVGSMCG